MLRRSLLALLLVLSSLPALAQKERHFNFHYAFTVKNVSPGERVRVWIPLAHSDAFQDVKIVSRNGDLPLKQVHQSEYGNEVLYAETAKAEKGEYKFSVEYDVVRREHVVLVNGKPATDRRSARAPAVSSQVELARFLEADRLVPVTGVPAELAAEETKGAATPLEKAKDIYEYVFRTMKYDKSGTGWGHGDTLWACDFTRSLFRWRGPRRFRRAFRSAFQFRPTSTPLRFRDTTAGRSSIWIRLAGFRSTFRRHGNIRKSMIIFSARMM
jgi:hypothetical protein